MNDHDPYANILTPSWITLNDEEKAIGGSLENAQVAAIRADIWFRGGMVVVIAIIFIGLNWQVISFIRYAFEHDVASLAAKPPMPFSDRLVTTQVLMTLIGATVVQTGVGVIAILSYLFPKRG